MKVAIVNQPLDPILPPEQNSIGIWTYRVAGQLAGDHDVWVHGRRLRHVSRTGVGRVHHDRGVHYRFRFAAPNRVWQRIGAWWERLRGPRRPIYGSIWYYLEYSLPLSVRLRRDRPDVIHIHNFTGFVPVIRLLNRRSKIVLHMSCEWLTQLDARTVERRIRAVDAVFGVSEYITGLVRERFPQYADRCHTVANGVDLAMFDAAPESPRPDAGARADGERRRRLVFVGRVSPEKGVHDLICAMRDVVAATPDVHLDVIGPVGSLARSFIVDVSDDPRVRELARFYDHDQNYGSTLTELVGDDLAEHVTFRGGLSHDDVVRYMADADLLLNPSYTESFGMSLVEAMACRKPVVATRVGGMVEIVDDSTGILVEPGDRAALAGAIVELLGDPVRCTAMGDAGRRAVERRFTWERVADEVRERYAELLAGRGRA